MASSLTPTKVLPPSLASAVAAGDVAGLIELLQGLEPDRAALEQSLLFELFQHPVVDVARAAAVACCRLRLAPSVSRLRGLLTDGDSPVGADVLAAVEGWVLPELVESYRELLETSDYPWKGQVLQNLAHFPSSDAGRLLAAFAANEAPELAVPALVGLRRFPSMMNFRIAREALGRASGDVAIEAARTVVAVGGRTALREQLRAALAASAELQRETLRLAREHGDARLGPDLEPWLQSPDDERVIGALETMSALGAAPSVRALESCLGNSDVRVRAAAMSVAPLCGPREALELLERGLADGTASVQCAAVETLAVIATPRAIELLRRALSSAIAATRARALGALHRLACDDSAALARQLLTDPAAEVRREALRQLGSSGQLPEPASLEGLLKDPDGEVRADARRLSTGGRADSDEAAQLAAAGYVDQAASLLVNDLVEKGEDARTVFQLGILLFGRGNHDSALEKFLRTLELEPGHSGALRYAAWTYEQLGNRAAQLDAARRLCDAAPGEIWAQRLLGIEAAAAGFHAEARERLERVAAAEPEDRQVSYHLGAAHLALGSLDGARRSLERSVQDPTLASRSHELLAELAVRQENPKDAEHHLRQVVGKDPAAAPDAAVALATILLQREQPAEAVRLLQPLVRGGSATARAWLVGAEAALAMDRPADALVWIERCPRLSAGDEHRRYLRGEALRRLGRLPEALGELAAAAAVNCPPPARLLALGRCQEALGDNATALETLGRYLASAGRHEPDVRILEARLLRRAGRIDAALEAIEPMAAWDEPGAEYHLESARCHLAAGAAGPALRHARLHAGLSPASIPGGLVLAEALLAAGDLAQAHRQLQQLSAASGAPIEARRLLLTAAHRLGEHAAVLELARELIPAYRDDGSFCEELGGSYHALEKWGFACEWLGRAARLSNPGRQLLTRLTESELHASQHRPALEHATQLTDRYPDDPVSLRLRGLALMALDRAAEAVPHLRKALEQLPHDDAARSALAGALGRIRDDAGLLGLYADAASVEAASEDALLALAAVRERQGERRSALELLERRSGIGALSPRGIARFAELCLADGDVVRCEGLLNSALAGQPDEPLLLEARAGLMMRRSRPRNAEADLQRALNTDPDRPSTLRLMGEVKLQLGAAAEAAAMLQRLVRSGGADARAHLTLARAQLLLTQPEKAEKSLRAALDADPQDPETACELVLLIARQGRREEARGLLADFASGRIARLEALCERAGRLAAEGVADEARWLRRELAALGAPVRLALLPVVLELVREKRDREAWTVILEHGSSSPEALPVLAEELVGEGRVDLAREVYRRSFELNGRNVSDLMGVARCHVALAEPDRALSVLREVDSRTGANVESRLLKARIHVSKANEPSALEALRGVLELEPGHVPALEMLTRLLVKQGKTEEASALVEQCLARDFGRAEYHVLKAAVCRAQGKLPDAADALLWAAGLDPACEDASCEAAALLLQKDDRPGARDVLARLLSANSKSRRGRLMLAQILVRDGDLDGVLREWAEAETHGRLDDEECEAYVTALWATGEREEGDRRANRLRLEHPESPRGWLLSARMARRDGNDAAAAELYSEALRRQPDIFEAAAGLAHSLERMGRPDEAISPAAQAVKLRPDDRDARFQLGRLQILCGQPREAIPNLEVFFDAPEEAPSEARLMLARAYLELGNRSRAADLLSGTERPGAEALELLADLHHEDGNWERAADAYGRLEAAAGSLDLARERRRVESCMKCHRLVDASSALSSLMGRLPASEAPALAVQVVELAERLSAERREAEAVSLLSDSLGRLGQAAGAGRPRLLTALARCHESAGRREEAGRTLDQGLAEPTVADDFLDAVAAFHASGQSFAGLRDRMTAVIRREPSNARAHLYLGAALCRLGQAVAGQDCCARAARLDPGSLQCQLGLARAASQAGDHETAVASYRRVLQLEPAHPVAQMELADAYDAAGLAALAVEHCQAMLAACNGKGRLARKAREVMARAGRSAPRGAQGKVDTQQAMLDCLRDGLLPEARAYAETFLRSNPYHLRALLVAGEVALRTGELERSRSHLGSACAQYPGSADAHAGLAAYLEQVGEPDQARAEALRAHELDPASAAIAIQLSRLLQSDSQLQAAEAVLTTTLESSEADDESVRVELANLAIGRGDPAAALLRLSEPAVVGTQAVTTLALAHEKSGDWRAAARLHSQLLAQDPAGAHKPAVEFARRALLENERAVAIGLGRQLARLGVATTALCQELARTAPSDSPEPGLGALLDTVLGHLPISVPTSERTALTVALSRQLRLAGRPAEALKRVEGALDLDPGDVAAQEELFKQLYAAGELSRLQTRLEKITFRAPDSASAWCLLASTRIALQRALPAQEAAARACVLEPAGFDARRTLARACKLASEYERAIAEYKAALQLRPNDPRTLYELAATYTASGLQELASGQWRRLLDHVPEGSELATAAWRFLKRATS